MIQKFYFIMIACFWIQIFHTMKETDKTIENISLIDDSFSNISSILEEEEEDRELIGQNPLIEIFGEPGKKPDEYILECDHGKKSEKYFFQDGHITEMFCLIEKIEFLQKLFDLASRQKQVQFIFQLFSRFWRTGEKNRKLVKDIFRNNTVSIVDELFSEFSKISGKMKNICAERNVAALSLEASILIENKMHIVKTNKMKALKKALERLRALHLALEIYNVYKNTNHSKLAIHVKESYRNALEANLKIRFLIPREQFLTSETNKVYKSPISWNKLILGFLFYTIVALFIGSQIPFFYQNIRETPTHTSTIQVSYIFDVYFSRNKGFTPNTN